MTIEAIIFDMDGVLVESEAYWEQARIDFAESRKLTWNADDQREAMGRSTVGWAKVMQKRLGVSMSIDEIIVEMKQRVKDKYAERMPERAGALDAVKRMQKTYRVALASGSPTEIIAHVMKLTGLDEIFEVIVFGDTIPNGKPAPDIYLEACKRMRLQPSQCVGIEDSSNGVRSLKAAGMIAIAAPSEGFPLKPDIIALADCEIVHMNEITQTLIESLL